MTRDTHPIELEEGQVTYALNAVKGPGDMMFCKPEYGTAECVDLPGLIGFCYLTNDRTFVCLLGDEFGIVENCTYTKLFEGNLGWSINYPIDIRFRVRKGCIETVYMVDGINPPRYYDINGEQTTVASLELFPSTLLPNIGVEVLDFGGSIEPCSIEVFFRYVDLDGNVTDWLLNTKPVAIYGTSFSAPYTDIVGALGTTQDPIDGIITNKSVKVSLFNFDTDFDFYQLGFVHHVNGVTTAIRVSDKIPVTATDYIYNGSYLTEEPIASTIGRSSFIPTHIEIIQNQLLLASTKDYSEDDCNLQQYASSIRLNWTVEEIDKYSVDDNNPKDPEYGEHIGYMRNEIYAVDIHYVYNTGRVTRGYTIPGRSALSTDLQFVNINTAVLAEDAAHLGLSLGDTVEYWRLYNTANASGTLGYYEADGLYPNDPDVWGSLANTPIRHHRMPDATLCPIISRDKIRVLGLRASNVVYPSSDIVGHYFSRSIRDGSNSTVVDKVVLGYVSLNLSTNPDTLPTSDYTDLFTNQGRPATQRNHSNFVALSHSYLFNGEVPNGDFLTFEKKYKPITGYTTKTYEITEDDAVTFDSGDDLELDIYHWRYDDDIDTVLPFTTSGGTNIDFKHRKINLIKSLSANNEVLINYNDSVRNNSLNLQSLYLRTNNSFNLYGGGFGMEYLYYGSVQRNIRPYSNIELTNFTFCHSTPKTLSDSQVFFGGDTHISPVSVHTFSSVNRNRNVLNQITGTTVVGGLVSQVYMESSKINASLRLSGKTYDKLVFQPSVDYLRDIPFTYTLNEGVNYTRDILTNRIFPGVPDTGIFANQDEGGLAFVGVPENYLVHNKDLFITNGVVKALPFPFSTFRCTECDHTFRNRIYKSEVAFQEELMDAFRVFRSNNYIDLDGSKGPITGLAKWSDNLMVFTTQGVWELPNSYQERASSDGIISYIGDGNIFSIPPRPVFETDVTGGGTEDKWGILKTNSGVLWIDTRGRDIFLSSKGSIKAGIVSWLEDNLGELLRTAVRQAGGTPPSSPYFAGMVSTFDRDYDRIVISYKDYEPLLRVEVTNGKINNPALVNKIIFDDIS